MQPQSGSLEEQIIAFANEQGERHRYMPPRRSVVEPRTTLWVAVNGLKDGRVTYSKADRKDARRILAYEPSHEISEMAGTHIQLVFKSATKKHLEAAGIALPYARGLRWAVDPAYDQQTLMASFVLMHTAAKETAQITRSGKLEKAAEAFYNILLG